MSLSDEVVKAGDAGPASAPMVSTSGSRFISQEFM